MSDIGIVCCVEAGPLEVGAARMAESVRSFGGRLAQARIMAVTPRFGPALTRKTKEVFGRLQVEYVRLRGTRWSWNNFMNKPLALKHAAENSRVDVLMWLDSDVIILQEPRELMASGRQGFAACAPDKNLGSTGPDDPNDGYWVQVCRVLGVDLDSLPMIRTEKEKASIRLYVNSGVFAFPRESGLAQAFIGDCHRLLESRVSSREAGIFFTDQVVLGVSAVRQGLAFYQLPHEYNYAVGGSDDRSMKSPFMSKVRVLHYHDAMWPWAWSGLVGSVRAHHPQVSAWLAPLGPMHNPCALPQRLLGKLLKTYRQSLGRRFQRRCTVY